MPLYRWNRDDLETIPSVTFQTEQLQERTDLQRLLRDQPQVLEEGLLIVAEEFSDWEESGRSIDLLSLDQSGRLVVIELKRTQSGDHMELQSIRYAAMVANMTQEQVIDAHRSYLQRRGIDDDPAVRIDQHLSNISGLDSMIDTASPRIILASAGFSKELTTSALWLNSNGLDVTCIKLQLYRTGTDLLLDASQVIPLPEAADYLVRVREKGVEERRQRPGQPEATDGGDVFRDAIEDMPEDARHMLTSLYEWAVSLEDEKLAWLGTRRGSRYTTLRPTLPFTDVRLGIIYKSPSQGSLELSDTALSQYAPKAKARIEEISSLFSRNGRIFYELPDGLLEALTDAYREANRLSSVTTPD